MGHLHMAAHNVELQQQIDALRNERDTLLSELDQTRYCTSVYWKLFNGLLLNLKVPDILRKNVTSKVNTAHWIVIGDIMIRDCYHARSHIYIANCTYL